MASHQVAPADIHEFWFQLRAYALRLGAAWVKATTRARVDRAGHSPLQYHPFPASIGVGDGAGGEESHGIGVIGPGKYLLGRAQLHYLAQAHDHDAIAKVLHHAQA